MHWKTTWLSKATSGAVACVKSNSWAAQDAGQHCSKLPLSPVMFHGYKRVCVHGRTHTHTDTHKRYTALVSVLSLGLIWCPQAHVETHTSKSIQIPLRRKKSEKTPKNIMPPPIFIDSVYYYVYMHKHEHEFLMSAELYTHKQNKVIKKKYVRLQKKLKTTSLRYNG